MKSIILFFIFITMFIITRFYFRHIYALRPKGKGFEFVYVENDGVVRELDEAEQVHLSEKFHPTDGVIDLTLKLDIDDLLLMVKFQDLSKELEFLKELK